MGGATAAIGRIAAARGNATMVGELDEAEEVRRAQVDPLAFAPLYDRYFEPIYRYCFSHLGSVDAAADATGSVFAKALAGIGRFRPGGASSFRAWLFTIARNTVVDQQRASRPRQSLAAAEAIADPSPSPEETALRGDDLRALWAALPTLSADQQEVIRLRLAGLTDHEIAAATGKSLGAVKMLQVRAVARLRDALGVGRDGREASHE